MKYMTFNSSCAFAGVANMLAVWGVDQEDREIALGIGLPYLFEKECNAYLGGPMLQSAKWFNLYLPSIGFAMTEQHLSRENVPLYLTTQKTAMMGVFLTSQEKHAIVYQGRRGNQFLFWNNKWQHSDDPSQFCWTADEFIRRLDQDVVVAGLRPAPIVPITDSNFRSLYQHSCQILAELKEELRAFCETKHSRNEIGAALNPLFRPILLDGITMLELLQRWDLTESLRRVQKELLAACRMEETVLLSEWMDMARLMQGMDAYITLIREKCDAM